MPDLLNQPLNLACGATLSNRLAKAPLTEGLADPSNRANEKLARLYQRWSEGGAGLLISGNVQVDRRYLERAGNVAIDNNGGVEEIRAYAKAGTSAGNHFWMQINHPGRQAALSREGAPVAPSQVNLNIPGKATIKPRAMTEPEILEVITRFTHVASVARDSGFTGVQIHAAHGYLLSQFLSGLTNIRTDAWGGSLANRARLLLEVVRSVRGAVGADFPVGVKLNSADFQKGGFTNEECLEVVRWLSAEKIDLLEISGGNYEQTSMFGAEADSEAVAVQPVRAGTLAREGYFLDYAERIRAVTEIPLMITGGMRSRGAMEKALTKGGMDVIGIGRPMCVETDICHRLLTGKSQAARSYEHSLTLGYAELGTNPDPETFKVVELWGHLGWFFVQIWRLGEGQEPDPALGLLDAFNLFQSTETAITEALDPV